VITWQGSGCTRRLGWRCRPIDSVPPPVTTWPPPAPGASGFDPSASPLPATGQRRGRRLGGDRRRHEARTAVASRG
jgi:hypothetical protein